MNEKLTFLSVQIPTNLKKQLSKLAKEQKRSLSKQVLLQIQKSFEDKERLNPPM